MNPFVSSPQLAHHTVNVPGGDTRGSLRVPPAPYRLSCDFPVEFPATHFVVLPITFYSSATPTVAIPIQKEDFLPHTRRLSHWQISFGFE